MNELVAAAGDDEDIHADRGEQVHAALFNTTTADVLLYFTARMTLIRRRVAAHVVCREDRGDAGRRGRQPHRAAAHCRDGLQGGSSRLELSGEERARRRRNTENAITSA